jgi:hypothetical protein
VRPEERGFGEALGGDPGGCAFEDDAVGAALLGEAVEEERPVLGVAGDARRGGNPGPRVRTWGTRFCGESNGEGDELEE